MIYAPGEDSDQPAHPHSHASVFPRQLVCSQGPNDVTQSEKYVGM